MLTPRVKAADRSQGGRRAEPTSRNSRTRRSSVCLRHRHLRFALHTVSLFILTSVPDDRPIFPLPCGRHRLLTAALLRPVRTRPSLVTRGALRERAEFPAVESDELENAGSAHTLTSSRPCLAGNTSSRRCKLVACAIGPGHNAALRQSAPWPHRGSCVIHAASALSLHCVRTPSPAPVRALRGAARHE
ncbi:hypothetical protein BD413DRAFT_111410 [Trametes elegans]|nr:hypothetical protein BD413DRAFT_111410 [Trametes elegans]